ncbi:DUF1015 domain-containing protein [Dehalogenimonas sp. THU2]|uniref:DUF1015 domain-containing protein n=1 Tax=Dehalogenimonas sp. THU2 TaxID=3151121 RepID=UPI0032187949
MADVRSFNAIRYKPAIENMTAVICPPYDVIGPKQEEELLKSSPHNYIRIEYSKALPGDDDSENRYTRALTYLESWLKSGVLQQDETPAYYLHEHTFSYEGQTARRRGLFTRVRLEEWDRMIVRPHEKTLAGPKRDRIKLISTLEANTSPVFGLYQDEERSIADIIEQVSGWPETLEFTGENGEFHRLWMVNDVTAAAAIERSFIEKPIYIADGHHRYESALAYRNESYAANPDIPRDAALNFVMMSLTDMADPGLLILPTHRLVKGLPVESIESLTGRLGEYFDVERFDLPGGWQQIDPLMGEQSSRFFVYGLNGKELLSLTVKDPAIVELLMPADHTATYKGMDVSVVDHVVLEKILGMNAMDEERIAYDHDRESTVSRVESGEFQFAFILKPVRPETIQSISDARDRMPRKSTYFYPKLPSGIVLYRLKD